MSFASSCNKFFVNSLGPTASMSSSNADVQFRVHKQTRIALILNETVFFQLARQVFLPARRRCPETQQGLAHFCHQNLRVQTFRWLCTQLFAFADFSVEESLCTVGHKSFVSLITFSRHLAMSIRMPCVVAVAAKQLSSLRISSQLLAVYLDPHIVGVFFIVCTQRPDMTCVPTGNSSSYIFEDFHVFMKIELFLTSLLLGRQCHVLVSLEETFHRRLSAVDHLVSLLDVEHGFCYTVNRSFTMCHPLTLLARGPSLCVLCSNQ